MPSLEAKWRGSYDPTTEGWGLILRAGIKVTLKIPVSIFMEVWGCRLRNGRLLRCQTMKMGSMF